MSARLLTRQQAADALGVSAATIDIERKAGRLGFIQYTPCGKVYFTEELLAEYVARGTHRAIPLQVASRQTYRRRRI